LASGPVGPGPGGADAESGTTAARQRGFNRRREEEADERAPLVSGRGGDGACRKRAGWAAGVAGLGWRR
jgi:hypothetical protein